MDRVIRRMPPMANDWALGLASGQLFESDRVAALDAALDAADTNAADAILADAIRGVETANDTYFRFDLDDAVGPDEPRRADLTPDCSTHDLGLGLMPELTTRKLVALVVLALPDGAATLVLDNYGKTVDAQPGLLVMFPAYCSLRVAGSERRRVRCAAFHAYGRSFR